MSLGWVEHNPLAWTRVHWSGGQMLSRRRAQPVHRGLQVMHAMVVLISFASGTHPRDGPRQGGRGTRAQQQSGWSIQGTGEGRLLHREGIVVRLRGGGGLKRGEAINFQTLEPVDMGMGSVDDVDSLDDMADAVPVDWLPRFDDSCEEEPWKHKDEDEQLFNTPAALRKGSESALRPGAARACGGDELVFGDGEGLDKDDKTGGEGVKGKGGGGEGGDFVTILRQRATEVGEMAYLQLSQMKDVASLALAAALREAEGVGKRARGMWQGGRHQVVGLGACDGEEEGREMRGGGYHAEECVFAALDGMRLAAESEKSREMRGTGDGARRRRQAESALAAAERASIVTAYGRNGGCESLGYIVACRGLLEKVKETESSFSNPGWPFWSAGGGSRVGWLLCGLPLGAGTVSAKAQNWNLDVVGCGDDGGGDDDDDADRRGVGGIHDAVARLHAAIDITADMIVDELASVSSLGPIIRDSLARRLCAISESQGWSCLASLLVSHEFGSCEDAEYTRVVEEALQRALGDCATPLAVDFVFRPNVPWFLCLEAAIFGATHEEVDRGSTTCTVEWGAGEEVEKRLGALIGEEGERARRRMRREIGFTAGKPCRDEKDVMVKGEGGDGGGSPSVELEGIREAYNLRVGMECARRMGVCPGGGGGGNVGKSADDLMIDWSRKGWVGGCVHAALHLGANPCIADAKGDTAMHLAAGQGHPETCHAIIEVGGDANAVNSEGLSPRLLAEKRGHSTVYRRLTALEEGDAQLFRAGQAKASLDRIAKMLASAETTVQGQVLA